MKMQNALHATDAMAQIRAAKRKQEKQVTYVLQTVMIAFLELVLL